MLKTDGPVTGNITYSLLANTAWPSYRRIARSISNKIQLMLFSVNVNMSFATVTLTSAKIFKYSVKFLKHVFGVQVLLKYWKLSSIHEV